MESGIMGSPEKIVIKPSSLEELRKIDTTLGKHIDNYLTGPNSKINLDRGIV